MTEELVIPKEALEDHSIYELGENTGDFRCRLCPDKKLFGYGQVIDHIDSIKHKRRSENALYYQNKQSVKTPMPPNRPPADENRAFNVNVSPGDEEKTPENFFSNLIYCTVKANGDLFCTLCEKGATEGHFLSELHQKRLKYEGINDLTTQEATLAEIKELFPWRVFDGHYNEEIKRPPQNHSIFTNFPWAVFEKDCYFTCKYCVKNRAKFTAVDLADHQQTNNHEKAVRNFSWSSQNAKRIILPRGGPTAGISTGPLAPTIRDPRISRNGGGKKSESESEKTVKTLKNSLNSKNFQNSAASLGIAKKKSLDDLLKTKKDLDSSSSSSSDDGESVDGESSVKNLNVKW